MLINKESILKQFAKFTTMKKKLNVKTLKHRIDFRRLGLTIHEVRNQIHVTSEICSGVYEKPIQYVRR
jgi:hypothetical protein